MTIPMHRKLLIGAVVLLILAVAALIYITPSSSPTKLPATSQTISTPEITFGYQENMFGLAVTDEQVLVKSYIPPCDSGFDYCLYYIGGAYNGTNFESAGVRIKQRTDLTTQNRCLSTLPDGFMGIAPRILMQKTYGTSVFAPIGDAGAGHYANGAVYRLSFGGTCFEFQTRIGETQFANYEPGTIKEFTAQDQKDVEMILASLLAGVHITNGDTPVLFPKTGE
jgi:hypothetical protein